MKTALAKAGHGLIWFLAPTFFLYALRSWDEAARYRSPPYSEEAVAAALLVTMILWGIGIYWLHWKNNGSLLRASIYFLAMIPLLLLSFMLAAFVVVGKFGL